MFNLKLGKTSDVDMLLEVAERFYSSTEISKLVPLCRESVTKQIYRAIATGFIIIADDGEKVVGVLGCETYTHPFNNAYKGCMEAMFWMDESVKGSYLPVRIMHQAEECAKALGVDLFLMASIPTSPSTTKEWYKRLGYIETDCIFMKLIGD